MGGRDHSETCEDCGCQRGGLNDLECECDWARSLPPQAAIDALCDGPSLEELEILCVLDTLAHNLAIAAALCRAWRSGYTIGGANPQERDWWKPGCQRPMP